MGIIIAAFIPVTKVLALVFLREKFSNQKAVTLVLALPFRPRLDSYSCDAYTDAQATKKRKEAMTEAQAS
jgi:hypothetical protein